MSALEYLKNLSAETRDEIANKFGSPEELLIRLISLAVLDHKIADEKPEFYEIMMMEIRFEVFDIQDKLDEINVDGFYLVNHVMSDFEHATRSLSPENLDDYFNKMGFTESKSEAAFEYYMKAFSYTILRNAIRKFFGAETA